VARSGFLALVFLFLSSASCLLYTGDINHPPEVELTGDTETNFHSAQRPKYLASARDQDQSPESLTYEWHRQLGACPAAPDAMVGVPVGPSKPEFENDLDFGSEFCVWVVVRDKYGAWAWDSVATKVKHQPTVAIIDVVKPAVAAGTAMAMVDRFPLLSQVHLSGASSDDPESDEPLEFQWTLTRGGQMVIHDNCSPPSDSELCFNGEQDGTYVATLKVKDARGVETTAMKSVVIAPDAPPCIGRTDPMYGLARIVRDATEKNDFALKVVTDDVDPFPAPENRESKLSFDITWWRDGEDQNLPSGRRATGEGDQMPVATFGPGYFKNGDQIFVRIKAIDRVNRDFEPCKRDKVDNCELDPKEHPGCYQWVTWRIDFRSLREM